MQRFTAISVISGCFKHHVASPSTCQSIFPVIAANINHLPSSAAHRPARSRSYRSGALNANCHFHSITPAGVLVPGPDGRFDPVELLPPTDEDIERLTRRIARRLVKAAKRYLALEDDVGLDPDDERATLQVALDTALRPPVKPPPTLAFGAPEPPPPSKTLCATAGGFSLHAARTVDANDREGLERLCRYGLRAPFSQRRLSVLPDGKVRYELPKPWPTPTVRCAACLVNAPPVRVY